MGRDRRKQENSSIGEYGDGVSLVQFSHSVMSDSLPGNPWEFAGNSGSHTLPQTCPGSTGDLHTCDSLRSSVLHKPRVLERTGCDLHLWEARDAVSPPSDRSPLEISG